MELILYIALNVYISVAQCIFCVVVLVAKLVNAKTLLSSKYLWFLRLLYYSLYLSPTIHPISNTTQIVIIQVRLGFLNRYKSAF
jgi:hypothetical protein